MRRPIGRPGVRRPGRGLLAGVVLISSIGSCQMPKPNIPSIGALPGAAPSRVPAVALGGPLRQGDGRP